MGRVEKGGSYEMLHTMKMHVYATHGHVTKSSTRPTIKPDEIHGRTMRTGEDDLCRSWIWSRTCGAHTTERVRTRADKCEGKRNAPEKRRLEAGNNPYTGSIAALSSWKCCGQTSYSMHTVPARKSC